jgi:hypothetical protein
MVPRFFAKIFFKENGKEAFVIMLLTRLMDLEHLLASPIFDANRCSMGYHPLHTVYASIFYLARLFSPSGKLKAVSIGRLWHLSTDYIDGLL